MPVLLWTMHRDAKSYSRDTHANPDPNGAGWAERYGGTLNFEEICESLGITEEEVDQSLRPASLNFHKHGDRRLPSTFARSSRPHERASQPERVFPRYPRFNQTRERMLLERSRTPNHGTRFLQ